MSVNEELSGSGGGWIEWGGGEWGGVSPVDADTQVEVKFRPAFEGEYATDKSLAKNFFWKHQGLSGDIIAYRIVGA